MTATAHVALVVDNTGTQKQRSKRNTPSQSFLTDQHPIYGGKAEVVRTQQSGGYWHFRMWISEERKYVRKTLKTTHYGGVSWRPLFKEGNTSVRSSDSAIAWELALKRGIRRGDWKAVYDGDAPFFPGDPRTFKWRLFNVVKDPGERVDLSHEYPELLATMVQVWQDYANRNGVYIHPEVIDSTLLGR